MVSMRAVAVALLSYTLSSVCGSAVDMFGAGWTCLSLVFTAASVFIIKSVDVRHPKEVSPNSPPVPRRFFFVRALLVELALVWLTVAALATSMVCGLLTSAVGVGCALYMWTCPDVRDFMCPYRASDEPHAEELATEPMRTPQLPRSGLSLRERRRRAMMAMKRPKELREQSGVVRFTRSVSSVARPSSAAAAEPSSFSDLSVYDIHESTESDASDESSSQGGDC